MRRYLALGAVLALVTLAAACEPDESVGPLWAKRACDQPRIDLATAKGQPLFRDSDSESLQTATWELWYYEREDSNTTTGVKTLTASEYYFEWNTPQARTAPGGCYRDTTITVDTI